MTANDLETALRSMVRRYGFVQVNRCLQKIGLSEGQSKYSGPRRDSYDTGIPAKSTSRRPKISATEYVAKLDLPLDKKPVVVALAKRFECKTFLPTFGDIANFCQTHGLKTPMSKTRASTQSCQKSKVLRNVSDPSSSRPHRGCHYSTYHFSVD